MVDRIGPKMAAAVLYVHAHPGCPILPVAEDVGANGSRRYGYAVVHRAMAAGLIEATSGKGNAYALWVADDAIDRLP